VPSDTRARSTGPRRLASSSAADPGRALHLLNGDSVAAGLRAAGMPGTLAVWGDVLCEGPLPATTSPAEWREVRAGYLAEAGHSPKAEALAQLARWDEPLAQAERYAEIVLWFEHDLHDQVLLVRHLAWFTHHPHPALSLICIGSHPEVTPFHGLGQLRPAQLGALLPERRPVTEAQLTLGTRAWHAFTADAPEALQALLDGDTVALPFLAGAVRRYLEEYPAVLTGLSRTERQILEELRPAPADPAQLFSAVSAREERVFLGDSSFWHTLQRLAAGPAPLLRLDVTPGAGVLPRGRVRLSPTGSRVLSGAEDRVRLCGIDRWHGGVHLRGRAAAWRWDPARGRIVPGG
jgi:Domain of unknown function (DUF1835)